MVLGGTEGGAKIREALGRQLRKERVVTQGDPVSLKIFNVIVDAVVRAVLLETCGPQEAHHEFG